MDIDLFGVFSGKKVDLDPSTLPIISSDSKKRKNDEMESNQKNDEFNDNDSDYGNVNSMNTNLFLNVSTHSFHLSNDKNDDGFESSSSSSSSGSAMKKAKESTTESTSTEIRPPAKVYPFQLDGFQKESIGYIERDESVLVAAHTSAGKTAVAEYAIAKSLRDKQRVIYTSPIKALSNQKYRDLQEEFQDVGLMTGDMTINPNATCLIMTTEILRSMLYRGSEVIREVAWVIYDEVHYMRDKERGVVWEESIILLPHKVRFVFLSATIPNAKEFVDWVAKIHRQPCHVVYTEYRPVPLQHFVFPAGSEGLYLVVDEKGKFRDDNFQKAMGILQSGSNGNDSSTGDESRRKSSNSKGQALKQLNSDLFKIVRLIMDRELDPCIVFSFSKKDCETYALQMARLDFNDANEKLLVEQVFTNAMEALSEDDQSLPQVSTILPLLKRGIGIHHGGLLPILKEVIEILFQEGLIKCLFATETFSIGINMPAKTVVFTKTRKFDGKDFRWISSGEYIQMSGRAGRRGKDDKGIVIQMLDEKMEPDIAKDMIYGASDPLHSSYHVSYNMLLNMMRVEDADPENILKASFHQYQQEQAAPKLLADADELIKEAQNITIDNESMVMEYYSILQSIHITTRDIVSIIMQPNYVVPFLQPGRVITITLDNNNNINNNSNDILFDPIYAIVINVKKSDTKGSTLGEYNVDVFVEIDDDSNHSNDTNNDNKNKNRGKSKKTDVISTTLSSIRSVSAVRLKLPSDFTQESSKQKVLRTFQEVQRRFEGTLPILDPVIDFGVSSHEYSELKIRLDELNKRLNQNGIFSHENKNEIIKRYTIKLKLFEDARQVRAHAKESQAVAMKDTMRKMKRVLRKLQYITEDGVLGPKGRFACELTTGDELVLTDMIFDGAFNELTPEQTVAILSCFVHKEGQTDERSHNKYRSEFHPIIRQLQTTARNVSRVCNDAKLLIDEEEYVNSFNTMLLEVTFAWASGSRFVDICKLTEIFEGSIIRSIRRLEELMRQLASASHAIGNHELKKKFDDGADKIRRGVVFAASLYI